MDIFYYAAQVGVETISYFSCTNSLADVQTWIDAANALGNAGAFELKTLVR